MRQLKHTKVIATLGPSSWELETMRGLIRAGADCFRLNFSHAGPEAMKPIVTRARQAAQLEGVPVTLLADVQGPKIRVGELPSAGVELVNGASFMISRRPIEGTPQQVHCPYQYLPDDLAEGARILFADGTMELMVERIEGDDVFTTVVAGGRLYSRKGLNLPGRGLTVATLTEKDEHDLAYIGSADIDIVAISFVRSPDDLLRARTLLGDSRTPVMAKLERPEALDALDDILDASDGVMVARGDLGVELPFEQVPVLQKRILERAQARGKWAVVATQLLASMTASRRPSRAEASDVVNAVLDGADAVMMSEETAVGSYPLESVQTMRALTREGERYERELDRPRTQGDVTSFAAGSAQAAVAAAERMQARAVVTLAGSGLSALHVSKVRPRMPIVAMASWKPTLNRLNVLHGVVPVEINDRTALEEQLLAADRYLLEAGWAKPGDTVVVAAAMPLGSGKETNTIRFHRVREVGEEILSVFPG